MRLNYQRIDRLSEMLTSAINAGLFESEEWTSETKRSVIDEFKKTMAARQGGVKSVYQEQVIV